ncbi:VirB3 family type IV secretion system protein [Paraburkholderia susongensis]|uniref:Type IV secretion system protein VirB3 n=1 Tax=Paraburkholderia susongensis TaxID=1515439 RepID=A0A1X7M5U7_9BURK|nr:VirB3 family type IV secretion system protein [Paraburkholderia susongensis]SMG61568.1 type IV secretion system protein VirB3 [Paraburkholderia susongensis]
MAGKKKYSAYAGLARVASVYGVPLMPLLVVAVASLAVAMVGAAILGPGGLAFGALGLPVVLFFRQMCATDDQALRILWLEILCVLRRRNWLKFGKTLTLAPIRYGRSLAVYRRPFRKAKRVQIP